MSNDLIDKEILIDFHEESYALFEELETVLEEVEGDPKTNFSRLETFGQIIDRMMGTAKSIGLDEIGKFCELGKIIGYKAGQVKDPAFTNIVVAILFDAVEILKKLTGNLIADGADDGGINSFQQISTKSFISRLVWLSDKLKNIDRASCSDGSTTSGDTSKNLDQNNIDELLKLFN